jgi:hypothetical protein
MEQRVSIATVEHLHTTNAVMSHNVAARLTEKNEISFASFPVK